MIDSLRLAHLGSCAVIERLLREEATVKADAFEAATEEARFGAVFSLEKDDLVGGGEERLREALGCVIRSGSAEEEF
jgi:hypothetical protein